MPGRQQLPAQDIADGNQAPTQEKGCSYEGCDGRHYGKGWCWKHYIRVRRHGSPEPRLRPFDEAAQQAVIEALRRGLTLQQAAEETGISLRTINNCTDEGRKFHPRYQEFARQLDVCLRLNKRAKRRIQLSPEGQAFLAQLERETAISLRLDPSRQQWARGGRTSTLNRHERLEEELEASQG